MFIKMFKIYLMMLMIMVFSMMNNFYFLNTQMLIMYNETFMNLNKTFSCVIDMFSLGFSMIILIVVFNVLSFMNVYMNKNNLKMFFFMTKMFIFSMFILVYTFNMWTMILGWEGLGMSSFYLIFYYNNYDSWKSAIKTFINNKIGDCLLLVSMIYMTIYTNKPDMVSLMFLMAMMTKSAQYPFMAWLPMAMSAPTPISAMVHSSTLVTAGLFIMFRFINWFLMKFNMNLVMNLCLMSMFISGMKAMMEKDMKKMIALSTLSQISLIFFFLVNKFKILAFMYMCNHALFKSLMFINMGMMMLNNFSNQIKFNMNNSDSESMFMLSFKISCFNLMNLSFFSSFFIKEKLIFLMENNLFNMMKMLIFLINSFFTMNYSLKMVFFFNNKTFSKKENNKFSSKKIKMTIFMMNLLSICFSKMITSLFLCSSSMNLFTIFIYLLSMMMNFMIYKVKYMPINSLMYLNFVLYILPMNLFKNKTETNELWMEKFSLNFYFLFQKKLLKKTFNMNYTLTVILILILMFI